MTDHDLLFKTLLTTFFTDFLDLFLPELAGEVVPESLELLDKEVLTDLGHGEHRVVDILARLRTRSPLTGAGGTSLVFVHVENQASHQPGFPRRLFQYFVRLVARHGEAIYPVAVFSYDRPDRAEPESYEVTLPGLDVMRFRFRVIQLGRLHWRDFLARPNPVAAALMARMRIAEADQPRVKAACLRMLVGLRLDAARTALVSSFVDSYLRLDEAGETLFRSEIEHTDPDERTRVMEIVTSWQLQGRKEGRIEGRSEGRVEGRSEEALQLVARQLARRLGTLPAATEAQVRALPIDALEELAEELLDFTALADLDRWLAERSSPA